jgi:hypothetical protein
MHIYILSHTIEGLQLLDTERIQRHQNEEQLQTLSIFVILV